MTVRPFYSAFICCLSLLLTACGGAGTEDGRSNTNSASQQPTIDQPTSAGTGPNTNPAVEDEADEHDSITTGGPVVELSSLNESDNNDSDNSDINSQISQNPLPPTEDPADNETENSVDESINNTQANDDIPQEDAPLDDTPVDDLFEIDEHAFDVTEENSNEDEPSISDQEEPVQEEVIDQSNSQEQDETSNNNTSASEQSEPTEDRSSSISDTTPSSRTGYQRLTVNVSQGGQVKGIGIYCGNDCVEFYDDEYLVTLEVITDPGYQFEGWSGDCTGFGSCQISSDRDRHVTANFSIASTASCL